MKLGNKLTAFSNNCLGETGIIFCLSLLAIHVFGLNFVNHEAKDYFPEGLG